MTYLKTILLIVLSLLLSACQSNAETQKTGVASASTTALKKQLLQAGTPEYQFDVIRSFNHPAGSYTEGLLINDDLIYESTGQYGHSKLRTMNINDGSIIKQVNLEKNYFGEGAAIIGQQLFQLTYLERTMFVYDKTSLHLLQTWHYDAEGWGLTNVGSQLIMSNGTSMLTYIHPQTHQITQRLHVIDKMRREINAVNELEYINGKIFANVWPTEIIIIISPVNGVVEGWFDISALKPAIKCKSKYDCVANGIAYHASDDTLFVTGKNWPKVYVIKLIH